MVKIIECDAADLVNTEPEQRAIVAEDVEGRYGGARGSCQTTGGKTFFWSRTSDQADRASAIEAARAWAERKGLMAVYVLR